MNPSVRLCRFSEVRRAAIKEKLGENRMVSTPALMPASSAGNMQAISSI